MRVIITGSRDWAGIHAQTRLTEVLCTIHDLSMAFDEEMVIVHGDCPTGADVLADQWGARREDDGVTVERHPADWSVGRAAGPLRNQKMADLGADVCVAFLRDGSRGTTDMITKAKEAGIPTKVIPWEPEWP